MVHIGYVPFYSTVEQCNNVGGSFLYFRYLIPTSPQYIARIFLYVHRKTTSNDLACHIGAHKLLLKPWPIQYFMLYLHEANEHIS
jgi:hypothetical protein